MSSDQLEHQVLALQQESFGSLQAQHRIISVQLLRHNIWCIEQEFNCWLVEGIKYLEEDLFVLDDCRWCFFLQECNKFLDDQLTAFLPFLLFYHLSVEFTQVELDRWLQNSVRVAWLSQGRLFEDLLHWRGKSVPLQLGLVLFVFVDGCWLQVEQVLEVILEERLHTFSFVF